MHKSHKERNRTNTHTRMHTVHFSCHSSSRRRFWLRSLVVSMRITVLDAIYVECVTRREESCEAMLPKSLELQTLVEAFFQCVKRPRSGINRWDIEIFFAISLNKEPGGLVDALSKRVAPTGSVSMQLMLMMKPLRGLWSERSRKRENVTEKRKSFPEPQHFKKK